MLQRGYKVGLTPNNKQISLLKMHAGTARFAYNWGLTQHQTAYKADGTTLDAMKLHKKLNLLKQDGTFAWMYQASKCAPQEALRDLDKAYQNYFTYLKKRKQGIPAPKVGFPRYKKKGKSKDTFRLTGTIKFYVNGNNGSNGNHRCGQRRRNKNHVHSTACRDVFTNPRVHLPVLKQIKLKEIPKFLRNNSSHKYHIQSATVSRSGDRWFVSFSVLEDIDVKNLYPIGVKQDVVGIDVGLSKLIVRSDGEVHTNPKPLQSRLRKLRRQSKSLSRRKLGSKNWHKEVEKISRLHLKIKNVRQANLHQISNHVVRKYEHIVIEDLYIKGMIRNKKLSSAIADVGWGEFYRQLQYKCEWYRSQLIIAPRFFASSKLCSGCEKKKVDLQLKDRTYTCDSCGLSLDRDENAAINLKKYGNLFTQDPTVATSWAETLNACGEDVRLSESSDDESNPDEVGNELQVDILN